MLQGVCSPFFLKLAGHLRQAGHEVTKVSFNGGDVASWRWGRSEWFRGELSALPEFYAQMLRQHDISDVILFGDCRPVHQPVLAVAKNAGATTHVFEEGYFRPNWITLERGGVNRNSSLPSDPAWYLDAARHVPDHPRRGPGASPFHIRAWHDVNYHVHSISNPVLFPRYRTHAPMTAAVEYTQYLRRALTYRKHEHDDALAITTLLQSGKPFYLLPLQMDGDAQIRHHSRFSSVTEVVDEVLASFAAHAPADAQIVVKNHPLDPGGMDFGHHTRAVADRLDITDRVLHLETGNLPELLRHTRGVVTVNSTVGGSALLHKLPTMALGPAIYALPGLTFQGGLDAFWREGEPPSSHLFEAFRNVVIHATQVDGGFYAAGEIDEAVRNAAQRLQAGRSPLQELLEADSRP